MKTIANLVPALDHQRCQFSSANGRRCRMPRWQAHPAFCFTHARAQDGYGLYLQSARIKAASQADIAETPDFAAELLPSSGEFRTATEINRALGSVFLLLAQNRVSRRNAVALGYLAQLLLQTLPGVREELTRCLGQEAWEETLDAVFPEDETDNDEPKLGAESTAVDETNASAEDQAEAKADREPSLVQSSEKSGSQHEPNLAHAGLGTPISALASCAVSETRLTAATVSDERLTHEVTASPHVEAAHPETDNPKPADGGSTRTPSATTAAGAWPMSIMRMAKIYRIPRSRWHELVDDSGQPASTVSNPATQSKHLSPAECTLPE